MIKANKLHILIACLSIPLYAQTHSCSTEKLHTIQPPAKKTSLLTRKNLCNAAACGCILHSFMSTVKNATQPQSGLAPTAFALLGVCLSIYAENQ